MISEIWPCSGLLNFKLAVRLFLGYTTRIFSPTLTSQMTIKEKSETALIGHFCSSAWEYRMCAEGGYQLFASLRYNLSKQAIFSNNMKKSENYVLRQVVSPRCKELIVVYCARLLLRTTTTILFDESCFALFYSYDSTCQSS